MAVLAFARVLEIDGCAALGASDLPDLCADALQLGRIQGANELLLTQELEERGESAIAAHASEIGKPAGFAQVEALSEGVVAAGTLEAALPRPARVVLVRIDLLEQADHRAGRELHACQMIEPDARAAEAQIHPDGALFVSLELLRLHRPAAIRADNHGLCGGD